MSRIAFFSRLLALSWFLLVCLTESSLRVSASSVGGIKGFLQESESLKDYSPRRLGSFSLKKLKNPLSSDLSKANLAKNDSFQRMSSRKGYEELERDQHLMIDQSYIDALKHMSLSTIYKSALEGKRTGKGFELNGKVFGGVEEPTLVRKDGRKVIQFRFPQVGTTDSLIATRWDSGVVEWSSEALPDVKSSTQASKMNRFLAWLRKPNKTEEVE